MVYSVPIYDKASKDFAIDRVLDETMRKIDNSRDTYFDDLEAKNAAVKAAYRARVHGHIAHDLNRHRQTHSVIHHHHRQDTHYFPDRPY